MINYFQMKIGLFASAIVLFTSTVALDIASLNTDDDLCQVNNLAADQAGNLPEGASTEELV